MPFLLVLVPIQNLTRKFVMPVSEYIGFHGEAIPDDSFDGESAAINLRTNPFHDYSTPPIPLWTNCLLHVSGR